MRRNLLVLTWLVVGALFLAGQSWGVCPEEPNDNGACDTLHVDIWPGDEEAWPPWPNFARFPIRVTSDIPDPVIDSIAGFIIPLCYIHSNPSKYCSLSSYWNNTNVLPSGGLDHSIFRHLPDMATAEDSNWMMLFSQSPYIPWDTRILDLDGTSHFWLSLVPTGAQNQRFPGGSRVLTATMTFKLEDTATVCIEDCVWPPMTYLTFSRSDAVSYRPRHLMPVCQYVGYPEWPPPVWFSTCPVDEYRNSNQTFSTAEFLVESSHGEIVQVSPQFAGTGIADVGIDYSSSPPSSVVTGRIQYTVQDHCQDGGTFTMTAWDDMGLTGECELDVVLSNSPPEFSLFDNWRALAGYTMGLRVSATDPDGDAVTGIELDGFWYEPDSLQPPVNPPSFDGGNPGLFSWAPT
ncbi:MAG: hypothetical protein JSV10_00295, partial [Candidatus Zixiibacteriota bacterium]